MATLDQGLTSSGWIQEWKRKSSKSSECWTFYAIRKIFLHFSKIFLTNFVPHKFIYQAFHVPLCKSEQRSPLVINPYHAITCSRMLLKTVLFYSNLLCIHSPVCDFPPPFPQKRMKVSDVHYYLVIQETKEALCWLQQ